MRGSWRPNRTAIYWPPHSYGHQRCVFLVLQGCSTGGPGAQLSAGCWLSLPHLVSKLSDLQTGLVSKTNWLPVFTELYNSSIAHSISPHNWPSECVTSAIFGMACLAGSEVNIQHSPPLKRIQSVYSKSHRQGFLVNRTQYHRWIKQVFCFKTLFFHTTVYGAFSPAMFYSLYDIFEPTEATHFFLFSFFFYCCNDVVVRNMLSTSFNFYWLDSWKRTDEDVLYFVFDLACHSHCCHHNWNAIPTTLLCLYSLFDFCKYSALVTMGVDFFFFFFLYDVNHWDSSSFMSDAILLDYHSVTACKKTKIII